jgi:hypothetical protein
VENRFFAALRMTDFRKLFPDEYLAKWVAFQQRLRGALGKCGIDSSLPSCCCW